MNHLQALKELQGEVMSFDWSKIKNPTAADFSETRNRIRTLDAADCYDSDEFAEKIHKEYEKTDKKCSFMDYFIKISGWTLLNEEKEHLQMKYR